MILYVFGLLCMYDCCLCVSCLLVFGCFVGLLFFSLFSVPSFRANKAASVFRCFGGFRSICVCVLSWVSVICLFLSVFGGFFPSEQSGFGGCSIVLYIYIYIYIYIERERDR